MTQPPDPPLLPLRVTDVRQHLYCPRIAYWNYVVPVPRRLPPRVAFGVEHHAQFAAGERRRSLAAYGLTHAIRRFDVRLASPRLGLSGVIDLLLETPDERIPVEYKDTLAGVRLSHRVQLAAYALLLDEVPGPPVRRGMVWVMPEQRVYPVRLDAALRERARQALHEIRAIVAEERLPPPADRWAKCRHCEFLHFCGDRYEPDSQAE